VPNKAQDDDLVMSLVELALARAPEEREHYLHSACAHDSQLFEEVRKYVEWEERMNGFLLEPLYPATPFELTFEPGELVDSRFRIVQEVARGGMGIVYEAVDERLERRIAIKCAKPGFRKRLPPEVRHATEVSHPNVCKIYEIHTASTNRGEIDFITMEFLEGETLTERLRRGRLPEAQARAIAQQLCAGLAAAHRNQVIHGDLKSNNVILTTAADGAIRAVITDFGLARRPEATGQTVRSGAEGGTPDYMAPELWKGGKVTVASDIYALGVILYELASGQTPFRSTVTVSWEERLSPRPPAVNPKWDRVLARCLAADPARRFQSAQEVGQALAPQSRRWMLAAAAAIVLAAVSGVVTYQRAKTPLETVRLAVLPFEANADTTPLSEGLLLDTSDRLSHVKAGPSRRLTLIPISDALEHKVDTPAKAKTMLGATYALQGVLKKESGKMQVLAFVTDTRSLVHLAEWRGEYAMDELRNVPVALAGMVTETLKLPSRTTAATLNSAAYADYSAGVALARRDPEVDRALPLLTRAVAADPNSPLTHAALAGAQWVKYTLTKDDTWQQRALSSLKNAEQRNPDVAAVRLLSGLIRDYSGQYEQAQADLLRAIELDPNSGDAWRGLGKVYEDSNQPNQALAAYLKAIEVQPDYFKNYSELGYFYFRRGDYEEAVRQRRKVVELVPDLAEAHYELAAPYLNMGDYDNAERELNIAIRFQETANAVLGLGALRMYQGRDRDAIPYFERAIEIGPASSLFYLDLGTVRRRSKLLREAEQAYRKGLDMAEAALAKNPSDGYERSCLAYLYARLNDSRRADFEAAQALRLSGNAINVRWMVALAYEALGQHDRTLAIIQDVPPSMLGRLNRFPDLADLRADSRFQMLLVSHHVQ
jgi:serine/threonine protein kinase/tetratricopeptide (TPR) repeat protein